MRVKGPIAEKLDSGRRLVHLHTLFSFCRLMHGFPFVKEKVADLQLKKLKKLLIHAYDNFDFYRERMNDCGFDPNKLREVDELQLLPVLTKEEYRSFTRNLLHKNPEKYQDWYFDQTSGSTGIPLEIVRSWPERGYMIAKWLRELYLNGFRCTDHSFRTVVPSRLQVDREIFLQRFGLFRRTLIPYSLPKKQIVESYQKSAPNFFYGSHNEAVLFCSYVLENDIMLKKPKMYSVGGSVIDENALELFFRVLGKDNFFETYAAEETGVLAFQIRGSSGLHFSHDTTILELISPDGSISEKEGHCLITDLGIYGFPLIRYQLGDWLNTYYDEHGIRRIEKIEGRLNDWLIWKDGSRSGIGCFYEIMGGFSREISQFRIIQESHELLRILVVLSPARSDKLESPRVIRENIMKSLQGKLRQDVEYRVEFVDSLAPDTSGKPRMIISKVDQGGK